MNFQKPLDISAKILLNRSRFIFLGGNLYMTSMTSREFLLSAIINLKAAFTALIPKTGECDALFGDSRFEQVIGVAGLPFRAPVCLEMYKDPLLAVFLDKLLERGGSVLVLLQPEIRVWASGSAINEIALASEIRQAFTKFGAVARWGGTLNSRGEHLIDLRSPAPGPHYFANLLLGNRIGFPYALQTTPKSVVDRLGRGSFRAHAGTQVLATRWDMRQEENGFPANRQFYLVEGGRQIFYSADPNDANIATATCTHSQNHTLITYRTKCGLEIQRAIFLLPQQAGLPLATEAQRITLRNLGGTVRQLRLVYTGMFGSAAPGAFQEDVLYSNIILQAKIVKTAEGGIAAVGVDYCNERYRSDLRFHSMLLHQNGQVEFPREFCTNYNEFVGNGTLEHPQGLRRLSNNLDRKGPGFFALAGRLELLPGATCLADNFTGLVSAKTNSEFGPESFTTEIDRLIAAYSDPERVPAALAQIESFYERYCRFLQVKTDDEAYDAYCNYNLPFQVLYQTFVSRSFCQTQKGYREIGFREIQDIFTSMYCFVAMGEQGLVKELIKEWCGKIWEFGFAYHNFFWAGKEPGKWSDDALWLIQALSRYINLTGDLAILDEECEIAGTEPAAVRPIYDTVKAILRYSGEISIGKHGMPLLDSADWNDCLKLDTDFISGVEKQRRYQEQIALGGNFGEPLRSDYSESVMNAFLLKLALDETRLLAQAKKDDEYLAKLEWLAEKLYQNLQTHAWKEDFFARILFNRSANGNESRYLGAKGDGFSADPALEGTYFLNSFSWSILSNTATEAQIATMLGVLKRVLKTPYGLKLVTPADLSKVSPKTATGEYFPGDRENGAVFKHASMMAVAAMLKAAKQVQDPQLASQLADLAYWMFDRVLPYKAVKNPYLVAGNPRFCTQYNNSETGENIGPMLSGTSTWLALALLAAYGIEFTPQGMRIDPILKTTERELEYLIRPGRSSYRFRITKPAGFYRIGDGHATIKLDGQTLPDNLIPRTDNPGEHLVEVTFRKPDAG
jgi:cellobiose phosphorylase